SCLPSGGRTRRFRPPEVHRDDPSPIWWHRAALRFALGHQLRPTDAIRTATNSISRFRPPLRLQGVDSRRPRANDRFEQEGGVGGARISVDGFLTLREDTQMSEENKAIVARWFTEFWGNPWNPAVINDLAAPDIRFEYSMHAPRRGREDVRKFATEFRAAFPDLNFWGTADLIAEGDYVVGQWEG